MNKLSKPELDSLVKLAQNNNIDAKEKIILSHSDLINKLAHKFDYTHLDFQDLYQEGVCGILKAIEKFDFARNVKFTTVAQIYIFNFISLFVRKNNRTVRVPNYIINYYKKISDFKKKYITKYKKEPSIEIILDNVKINFNTLQSILDLEKMSYSLNDEEFTKHTNILEELAHVNTDNFYYDEQENLKMDEILSCIPEQDKEIIKDWSGLYSNSRNSYTLLSKKYNKNKREIKKIISNAQETIKNKILCKK